MTPEQFTALLQSEGFAQLVTVEREPGGLGEHAHPFEAKALILAGEIIIERDGQATLFKEGDVFHLPAEALHTESYGAAGVRYLVGRK